MDNNAKQLLIIKQNKNSKKVFIKKFIIEFENAVN